MRAAGVELLVDSSEMGVVGFIEVLRHFGTFLRRFRELVGRAAIDRPDSVVLIDYPGFNLRFAQQMHRLGIRVVYYISPQVWAWGRRRIPKIATWCKKVLAIFPFEPQVYAGTGLDVEFVGHPLVRIIEERHYASVARDPDLLVLLPGSRRNEVKRLLPPLVETAAWLAARRPLRRFVLPVPNPRIGHLVEAMLVDLRAANDCIPAIQVVQGDAGEWFRRADAGLAASGTVTVEAAIHGLPLVVAYRVSPITYLVGRLLVKIPYFTMVNLVANKLVFEEFLQGDVRPAILGPAVEAILSGGRRREAVMLGLREAVAALGAGSNSCERAARAVLAVAALPVP